MAGNDYYDELDGLHAEVEDRVLVILAGEEDPDDYAFGLDADLPEPTEDEVALIRQRIDD